MAMAQELREVGGFRRASTSPNAAAELRRIDIQNTLNTNKSFSDGTPLHPSEYSNAVNQHAKQTTTSSPFPGYNFENLALYLRRDLEHKPSLRAGTLLSPTPPTSSDFPFITSLKLDGTSALGQDYYDPSSLPSTGPGSAILFLKGKPSSGWLTKIGADYKLDPAFLNDHLDFRASYGRIDYFAYPPLPHAQSTIMQLPYITLGQLEDTRRKVTQQELDSMRGLTSKSMDDYWTNLHKQFDEDSGVGQSLVRNFHFHDHLNFAIEQRISIALCKTAGSWQLLVWLDTGRPLTHHPPGPWATTPDNGQQRGYRRCSLYPTIQVKPSVSLQPQKYKLERPTLDEHDLAQSASILHMSYGKRLDAATMSCDPFYALNDIFWFVASSYRQYLNMLEKKDANRTRLSLTGDHAVLNNPNPEAWDSTNIRYDRAVLEPHVVSLRGIIDIIRERSLEASSTKSTNDKQAWPRAKEDSAQAERASDAAKQLEKTFEVLLQQAKQLLTRYRDAMNVLMNRATMAEANKSLAQAREVAKLTKLAFVYIPLSFTASFFGMNLTPLNGGGGGSNGDGTDYLSLWYYFVVSLPVFFVSLIFMKWDFREMVIEGRSIYLSLLARTRPKAPKSDKGDDGSDDGTAV